MDPQYTTQVVRSKLPSIQPFFRSWSHGEQEIKPGMIELMKPKLSFYQSEIQDGDVICFQVEVPEKQ